MIRYQKKLEARQAVLNRIVDIGIDLFAMAATCSYADALAKEGGEKENAVELADLFCRMARKQIESSFKNNNSNYDKQSIAVSKKLLAKKYAWLESDIIK